MNSLCMFCIAFVWSSFARCEGITTYENEKNIISEDERRGVIVKEERQSDERRSRSTKRGLWVIGQHQPEYDTSGAGVGYHGSSGPGGYGYVDSGGYGPSGTGYNYASGEGGYHKGPSFGHGYGYTGGGGHFAQGVSFGHNGYEESGHELSQGHGAYNKLALKKLLIPLAGLAILGAAAAFSSNPVLLQLGTIHGKRKRSVVFPTSEDAIYPPNPWTKPDCKK